MQKKLIFKLLVLACLLAGCGEKFDYRNKYAGTFDFTYHYHFQWVGGTINEFKVERDTVYVDERAEKIQFRVDGSFHRLIVDKHGDLYSIDVDGLANEKVGSYDKTEDEITFIGEKVQLNNSFDNYLVSATRVD
jgi:hypothetical protein